MNRYKPETQEEKALTCIRSSYTLSNTPEPDSNETESLILKNFVKTLAEIALSIASRKSSDGEVNP